MFTEEQLAWANSIRKHTMVEGLGIEFIPGAPGTLVATMPVDHRTRQPMGLLHGGATAALAETLGSVGSAMLIDLKEQAVVGIELNANHLKSASDGKVTATGTLLHKGRTTHVWDIRVHNHRGELVAVCRLTNMVISQKR
ncbi:MAG: hotdog fold thioesterase [Flavobacteriales bacterium]|nr:hotdog fold thioesterase [Flavobacteriales bacterium]MCL4280791.1 hotdog fold thioesterase [Flavobacteriales bacterium]